MYMKSTFWNIIILMDLIANLFLLFLNEIIFPRGNAVHWAYAEKAWPDFSKSVEMNKTRTSKNTK